MPKAGHLRPNKLSGDLEVIQRLHKFRVQAIDRNYIRLVFDNQFDVVLACDNSVPRVQEIEVLARPQKQHLHNCLEPFVDHMVRLAYQEVSCISGSSLQAVRHTVFTVRNLLKLKMHQVVERLNQVWSSMGQVYSQLAFLAAQWPLTLNISRDTLEAEVQVLFRNIKAKARFSFLLDRVVLVQWPMTLRQLRYEVRVVYGKLE
jgi:hypothetical protein